MIVTSAITQRDSAVPTLKSAGDTDVEHAALFVWGFWGSLAIYAFYYVYRYGPGTPFVEDWNFVDFLTGKQELTWSWLFEQLHGGAGHRIPIAKLLFYLDYKLFGVDVRPVLYLNVILFVVLAAGMIWAARRVRGVSSFTDAIFPILLLNVGQGEVFTLSQTCVYVITTFLVGAFLIIQMAWGPRLRPAPAIAAGLCLILLPLVFSGGMAYVPFLGLWMGYTGYQLVRSSNPIERWAGSICLFSMLAAFLIVAAFMAGYQRSGFDIQEDVSPVGPVRFLKTSMKFLAISLGPWARRPAYPLTAVLVVAMLLVCATCLATSLLWREPSRRPRAVGLSLYLLAYLTTALAVGVARASWGPDYVFYPRFAAVSVPLMFGVYFVWECCGPPRWIGFGRMILFTILASNLALNNVIGDQIPWRKILTDQFEQDVRDGVSIPRLVSKYARPTHHDHDKLEECLKDLRNAKVGNYRYLPPDPKFTEVALRLTPTAVHNVTWDGKAGRVTGEHPFLVFDLEKAEFVCGLRIKYSSTNKEGLNPYFQVFMHEPGRPPGSDVVRYRHVSLPTGKEVDVPVWIYKTIDRIRVHPDKRPCDFTISEIVLLLPKSDADRVPNDEDAPEAVSGKHDDFADPIEYKK
jgi:hypothetical protein